MSSIAQTSVVLTSEKDWEPWIEVIRTASLKHSLWGYIDPSLLKGQVPSLARPIKPTANMVKALEALATTTQYSDLDTNEREYLRQLNKEYLLDKRTYEKQIKAFVELHSKVQSTVAKDNLVYTYDCEQVWDILINLKN